MPMTMRILDKALIDAMIHLVRPDRTITDVLNDTSVIFETADGVRHEIDTLYVDGGVVVLSSTELQKPSVHELTEPILHYKNRER